jgi:hypothetical protein
MNLWLNFWIFLFLNTHYKKNYWCNSVGDGCLLYAILWALWSLAAADYWQTTHQQIVIVPCRAGNPFALSSLWHSPEQRRRRRPLIRHGWSAEYAKLLEYSTRKWFTRWIWPSRYVQLSKLFLLQLRIEQKSQEEFRHVNIKFSFSKSLFLASADPSEYLNNSFKKITLSCLCIFKRVCLKYWYFCHKYVRQNSVAQTHHWAKLITYLWLQIENNLLQII